jgi:acetyltransferase-like isoleucine patch superfamily enzyme
MEDSTPDMDLLGIGLVVLPLPLVLLFAMTAVHRPDLSTMRWLAHQQWQHRDRLYWRRWQLAATLLGRGVHLRQPLEGNVLQLLRAGRIEFGQRVCLEAGVRIWGGPQAVIRIGDGVELRRNVAIGAIQEVEIGAHTLIAQGAYITDADHVMTDPDVPLVAKGMRVKGPTVIEENVWIGANAVITSGVRIGRASVVGANTVVTGDVPPYSVVTGVAGTPRASTPPNRAKGDVAATARSGPSTDSQ